MKTIEELANMYDDAQFAARVPHEPGNVTGHQTGIKAVRDAVLDDLATEFPTAVVQIPPAFHCDWPEFVQAIKSGDLKGETG